MRQRERLAFDGRRASMVHDALNLDELCSRSGGDAREAMTVGCKPTSLAWVMGKYPLLAGLRGSFLRFPPVACQASKTAFRSHCARPTGRYV